MVQTWKSIALIMICGLLAGCSSAVDCDVVAYHALNKPQGETFHIVHREPAQAAAPGFTEYATHIQKALTRIGYKGAKGEGSADLTFSINYGVGPGMDEVVEVPKCTMRYNFRYEEYREPYSYGMYCTDETIDLRATFNHFLEIRVYGPPEGGAIQGPVLYKGLSHSVSRHDNLGAMIPYLVTAIFDGFPGLSGEVKTVSVDPETVAK